MEVDPPYLFGAGDSVSATMCPDTAVIEMRVLGRWTRRLAADTYTGFRKCLTEHPAAILLNLHLLSDPQGASAPMWLTAGAAASRLEPPVRVALHLPATRPLAHRLRRAGISAMVPTFSSATDARTAVATGNPLTDRLRLTRLLPGRESARLARTLVDTGCVAWQLPELRHPARLVLSELVANAVQHAGTEIDVTVSRLGARLHLAVRDGDPRVPRLHTGAGSDSRGLRIVDTLATAWGVLPTADGKTVWATMRSCRRNRAGLTLPLAGWQTPSMENGPPGR